QKANRKISSTQPAEYLPEVEDNQPAALRGQCVPMDRSLWTADRYPEFLAARRQLLAHAMNEFIASWVPEESVDQMDEAAVRRPIAGGESETLEFKSSLRWDRNKGQVNTELEKAVIKTLAGLLNGKKGGTLLIGVGDSGDVIGLAEDYASLRKKDRDGFELHLRQLLARDLGESIAAFVTVTLHQMDGHDICQATVEPSDHPVYVTEGGTSIFYLRVGNLTRPLPVNEAVRYVQNRWGG